MTPRKARQNLLRLVSVGWLALHSLTEAHAATQVSGIIAGQTWTTAGSPYEVTGDLLVASLTIQPGVEVKFMGNFVFEVAGSVNAIGESGAMIQFRPANAATGWQGIYFNESPAGSTLDYCRIEGSKNGGIRIINSLPLIRHCVIANNSSAPGFAGGGIRATLNSGRIEVLSCVISNNVAPGNGSAGAGIALRKGSLVVSNSLIVNNRTEYIGGGLWAGSGSLTVVNSVVSSNSAANGGAAQAWHGNGDPGGDLRLLNCTVVGNLPNAFFLNNGSTLSVTNSIIYRNGTGSWLAQDGGSVARVGYSCTQGGSAFAGTGNISANPVLNPATYELLSGSPCIDTGNPAAVYNDSCFPPSMGAVRNDMGAFGGPGACLRVGLGADDADGDGLPDAWETQHFGNITSQDAQGDPDEDRLINDAELDAGTNPTLKDTDGDGYSDYAELRSKSDPLDPKSIPPADLSLTVEQVRLEFVAGVNQKVAIQSSSDLVHWQDVEVITGTGEVVTRIYNVSDGQRYFQTVRR